MKLLHTEKGQAEKGRESKQGIANEPAEDPISKNRRRLLIAFIASVFFVVVAAAYVCLIVGALVYLRWWAGLALIAFLSPYFIMMLRAIPFLRDVYINDYAKSPAPKGLPN